MDFNVPRLILFHILGYKNSPSDWSEVSRPALQTVTIQFPCYDSIELLFNLITFYFLLPINLISTISDDWVLFRFAFLTLDRSHDRVVQ